MEELDIGQILYYSFTQSDMIGKGIVVMLFAASMTGWFLLLNKLWDIHTKNLQCQVFQRNYDKIKSPLAMALNLESFKGPMMRICRSGITALCDIMEVDGKSRSTFLRHAVMPRKLTDAEIEKIRTTMTRQVDQEGLDMDKGLDVLSILITISPFLGLFGTVWGVMATFIAIARTSQVEISAIAPGISGALLTTVAGLVVAIPAVVANTIINAKINALCLRMETFVEDFLASLKLEDTDEK